MSEAYNLLNERWMPVRLANGKSDEFGLLEVFRRSDEIVALAETAPPNLVAQYRLLLAILNRALHRALPQGWRDEDRARWYHEGMPYEAVRDYLEHWRERFWLFHPEHPFMQVAALAGAEETRDKRKPWTQIALASANGNTPVVFDHAYDAEPVPIRPADAIGTLLGFLQFTPAGLVKSLRDVDKAGALVNTAAVVPVGARLAQTLLLGLHPAGGGNATSDLPAWERPALTLAELRGDPVLATGPNDRYTRQSRAVLLLREDSGDVRWLRFAAGLALGEDLNAPDPMASFRAGSNGLVRLTFSEGRALWRDLPAMVPTPAGGDSRAAAVLQWAIGLHRSVSFRQVDQSLLVAGLASDQAKLLRWRSEQLRLPVVLLDDVGKAQQLRALMAKADALHSNLRGLAARMQAETLPDPASKDSLARARSLIDAGPFTASFFAVAERALPELLALLGEGQFAQADMRWSAELRRSAQTAWARVQAGLGRSPRALRADAKFLPRFHGLLNKQMPKSETSTTAKEA